jgi:protein TonB
MLSIAAVHSRALESQLSHRALQWGLTWSAYIHLLALAALVAFSANGAAPAFDVTGEPTQPVRIEPSHIVFLASKATSSGKGGGGGGGGNREPGPIRRAASVGSDRSTLRVAKPIGTSGRVVDVERSLPALLLDAKPLASGVIEQLGLPGGGTNVGTSTGPGSGGGVGDGIGTGTGAGRGPGLGAGSGGGTGGGAYRAGAYRAGGGVTPPQLISQVRPAYTAEALEQRIQGSVELELVVTTEGTPSEIRIVRSLDSAGLDEEAIKAVQQWKFKPGRLAGVPVNVLVTVVLDFTIR